MALPWLLLAVILSLLRSPAVSQRVSGYPGVLPNGAIAAPMFRVDSTQMVVQAIDEVINGTLAISGEIDLGLSGDLSLVMQEVIYEVCTDVMMLDRTAVDPATVLDVRPRFNFNFYILARPTQAKQCVEQMNVVSYGPAEPPWGMFNPPAIRALLAARLFYHEPTRTLDLTNWFIDLNVSCEYTEAMRPADWIPTTTTVLTTVGITNNAGLVATTTPYPGCESVDTENGLALSFEHQGAGSSCGFASTACICSSLPMCIWVSLSSGVTRCQFGTAGVSCDDCATQDGCTPSRRELCAAQTTACGCALSSGRCRWRTNEARCDAPEFAMANVPCSACSRQSFCSPTSVLSTAPAMFAIMGTHRGGAGELINITFDRDVQRGGAGSDSRITLRCVDMTDPNAAARMLTLSEDRIILNGSLLHVNTSGIPNSETRDCDVLIGERAIMDKDFVYFQGWGEARYVITLRDMVDPVLAGFDPVNSKAHVSVHVEVTMTFSEAIQAGYHAENAVAIVTALGAASLADLEGLASGGNGAPRGNSSRNQSLEEFTAALQDGSTAFSEAGFGIADVVVAHIPLISSPRVRFDRERMTISLDGIITHDTHYSISLRAGSVRDFSNNRFAGLINGFYSFSTATAITVEEGERILTTNTLKTAGYAAGVASVVLLFSGFCVCRVWRRRRKRAAAIREKAVEDHLERERSGTPPADRSSLNSVDDLPGTPQAGQTRSNRNLLHTETGLAKTTSAAYVAKFALIEVQPTVGKAFSRTPVTHLTIETGANAMVPDEFAAPSPLTRRKDSMDALWNMSEGWDDDSDHPLAIPHALQGHAGDPLSASHQMRHTSPKEVARGMGHHLEHMSSPHATMTHQSRTPGSKGRSSPTGAHPAGETPTVFFGKVEKKGVRAMPRTRSKGQGIPVQQDHSFDNDWRKRSRSPTTGHSPALQAAARARSPTEMPPRPPATTRSTPMMIY